MARYELTVVFAPVTPEDIKTEPKESVESALKRAKAEIVATDDWGEKQMAYEVGGFDRAVYTVYTIDMTEEAARDLRNRLITEKGILRWLLVKAGEENLAEEADKE